MSDSTALIPWQHKESYSIEPMTNQDLDVPCFPTEGSRQRESKDGAYSDRERFASFLWEMKFDRVDFILRLRADLSLAIMSH